jgi:ferritin
MFSKKLNEAINEQIKAELYSGYLYLSMSAYFEGENLSGFAHWMRRQAGEEQEHALKFFDFVNERGGRVQLKSIDQPPAEFNGPTAVFEMTLEHEKKVTGLINKLYELALSEKDYPAQVMLQWFIKEQVEEEVTATKLVETLKMVGQKGQALVMMDRQLARRGE